MYVNVFIIWSFNIHDSSKPVSHILYVPSHFIKFFAFHWYNVPQTFNMTFPLLNSLLSVHLPFLILQMSHNLLLPLVSYHFQHCPPLWYIAALYHLISQISSEASICSLSLSLDISLKWYWSASLCSRNRYHAVVASHCPIIRSWHCIKGRLHNPESTFLLNMICNIWCSVDSFILYLQCGNFRLKLFCYFGVVLQIP